ncbi:MAG: threonine aldolase [Bacteroidetes bacterium GWF2_33_38]|nr:MAG: threonine aldolase [Bacteroidetes bacterium GWF2_33_38]OFY72907.1 MAG: threonine aldolase [Bacteroidetes bacterium RIFOXYA12_FULL_33_9]OFY92136.1 MAG: threonine aldolase [Bacteroidetes bacterium RIFOXYA2_FULL_33_7]
MYNFKNDYSEGCHPAIIDAIIKTNDSQQEGYGDDDFSIEAKNFIRKKLNNLKSEIYFISGGTHANLTVIAAALRPHESVVCCNVGHINVHETGAIEATGHKINIIHSIDGKIRPSEIQAVIDEHNVIPHMVKPKLVYISNSTEIGTIYKKQELQDLSAYCKSKGLFLFMDGARLGSALCAKDNDLDISDLAILTDVFYIGGTKNGALLGEAIVINNEALKEDFGFHLKQRGALMAKGRVLGIQFAELFRNDLFFQLATHANTMAMKMADALKERGFSFLTQSTTNQIFPILPNKLIAELSKKYGFYIWQKMDENHSAIRLVTSWATKEEVIAQFVKDIESIKIE